jgi:protease IV
LKDSGSPTREVTEADRKYFQDMVNELYDQFVAAVHDGRQGKGEAGAELTMERVRTLADGRVYTGSAALKNGLVDELGNYQDAIKATAKLAGIKGEPRIVTPPKPRDGVTLLDLLLSATRLGKTLSPSELPNQMLNLDTSIKFKYQLK